VQGPTLCWGGDWSWTTLDSSEKQNSCDATVLGVIPCPWCCTGTKKGLVCVAAAVGGGGGSMEDSLWVWK